MINLYLADDYCSITVANHGLSRLIRFVSRFTVIYAESFINRFYLVLHACVKTFDETLDFI